jgi:hypothetical protein
LHFRHDYAAFAFHFHTQFLSRAFDCHYYADFHIIDIFAFTLFAIVLAVFFAFIAISLAFRAADIFITFATFIFIDALLPLFAAFIFSADCFHFAADAITPLRFHMPPSLPCHDAAFIINITLSLVDAFHYFIIAEATLSLTLIAIISSPLLDIDAADFLSLMPPASAFQMTLRFHYALLSPLSPLRRLMIG